MNIFQTISASQGQIFQVPGMAKLFNRILESIGESPISYADLMKVPTTMQSMGQTAKPALQSMQQEQNKSMSI